MTYSDPSIIVVYGVDAVTIVGTPNNFVVNSNNPELKKLAHYYIENRVMVPLIPGLPHAQFLSGKSSYISLVAALFAVDVSKAALIEAPAEVWDVVTPPYTASGLF